MFTSDNKAAGRYLLFFIISLALYAFIFLYPDHRMIIKPFPVNSGEQAIQISLVSLPPEFQKPVTPASEPEQKTTVQPKPQAIVAEQSNSALSESEVKLRRQALQKNIAQISAESTASLKGAIFEKQLRADKNAINETQPEAEVKKISKISTAEKKTANDSKTPATSKDVIKKQPETEEHSSEAQSALNQGVLQQAIVVSGRKPVYPQRAILRNQQGRVVVKLTVTSLGKPKNPSIINSSGHNILDQAVLAFINRELFMPALKGQKGITSEQLFAFRFELN